jgi:NADH pyrophosphatase NudC (nudix superfamily)
LKDYCPGYWDPTPGGVVAAGEPVELTNTREVEEEMGIINVPMNYLFTFYYEDERVKCFGSAWDMVYDGPLRLQKEEVDDVEMMSMKEIFERFENGEKFTPDSLMACRKYLESIPFSLEPIGPKPSVILY